MLHGGEGLAAEFMVAGVWLGLLTSGQNRKERREWWHSAFLFMHPGDPAHGLLPPTVKVALLALV